jgi:beta-phosphoglucomutase
MNKIEACIFDLDGVICDTARYHFKAWKRLANELGFDFTEAENEQLKGVSRVESLNLILKWGGKDIHDQEEKEMLAAQKNAWYLEYIEHMTPKETLAGVEKFLKDLQKRGIKIALGSASKNSRMILDRIGLTHYFEVIIDGNSTSQSKPHPEVFLLGAQQLGVSPKNSIVFEDAEKGIEAALNGGFYAVGIGKNMSLEDAHIVIPSFEYIDIEEIQEALMASVGAI